jgi:hypothetical protein
VEYIGTGATTSTPFTITVTTCSEGNDDDDQYHRFSSYYGSWDNGNSDCDNSVTLTILSGNVMGDQNGSVSFVVNQDGSVSPVTGTTGVPQFPMGMAMALGLPLLGFILYGIFSGRFGRKAV